LFDDLIARQQALLELSCHLAIVLTPAILSEAISCSSVLTPRRMADAPR
jgi:hypothetical protein